MTGLKWTHAFPLTQFNWVCFMNVENRVVSYLHSKEEEGNHNNNNNNNNKELACHLPSWIRAMEMEFLTESVSRMVMIYNTNLQKSLYIEMILRNLYYAGSAMKSEYYNTIVNSFFFTPTGK